jgi:hypothetical protein
VLASAVAAHDAQRTAIGIGGHDGVHAIGLARAAVILDRVSGTIRTVGGHRGSMIARSCDDASARDMVVG